MKRAFGAMAANWLRKPQNQEKLKRGARQVWSRVQGYRQSVQRGAASRGSAGTASGSTRGSRSDTPPRDGDA